MQIPNAFVMPCFNEEMDREQFLVHDYNDNVFIYAGTLAAWQCFEQTVRLYKQIEETYGNIVRFLVLTQQQKGAVFHSRLSRLMAAPLMRPPFEVPGYKVMDCGPDSSM